MENSMFDDDGDEEALRLAALRSLQKPKFINTNNLISVSTNPFGVCENPVVKLEPISPSREEKFKEEKRLKEKESSNKTEDDLFEDDDSFEGLINQLQASIDGTDKTMKEEEEVEFLDVTVKQKRANSKEIIILESPPASPRFKYRSRSRSRRRSWSRRRYSDSRSPSPRYRRRRSLSWSLSPSPRPRARSPYRSPRRWSRSPRRRRSRSPRIRSRSPRRSPRRRSRTHTPPRNRSPVNRARKRDSPLRRRSPIQKHRRQKREKETEKVKIDDPVLEARRRKFESIPNPTQDKKINLKSVKDTIEPVADGGLDIRLDALSDDSDESDGQEGRFKCNTQSQTRGKLLSFQSIRQGTAAVPVRLEPISSNDGAAKRAEKPEPIRVRKVPPKRETLPKPEPSVKKKLSENLVHEKVAEKEPVVEKLVSGTLDPTEKVEPDLRSILAKKRKERFNVGLLPLQSRLVQSALQNLGEVKKKQTRRILVVDNSLPTIHPKPVTIGPKRRVRQVQDLEQISLIEEDSEPEEVILPSKRKLKVKRSVTIASQVSN